MQWFLSCFCCLCICGVNINLPTYMKIDVVYGGCTKHQDMFLLCQKTKRVSKLRVFFSLLSCVSLHGCWLFTFTHANRWTSLCNSIHAMQERKNAARCKHSFYKAKFLHAKIFLENMLKAKLKI